MKWDQLAQEPCPIARSLAVIGDRWTLLILRDCFAGASRFEEFADSLRISRPLVAARLAALVEHGLLEKVVYQERPPRHHYRLTRLGRSLQDLMLVLSSWGSRELAGSGSVEHVHTGCGHAFEPVVTCSHCQEPVDVGAVRTRFVPRLAKPAETSLDASHGRG